MTQLIGCDMPRKLVTTGMKEGDCTLLKTL